MSKKISEEIDGHKNYLVKKDLAKKNLGKLIFGSKKLLAQKKKLSKIFLAKFFGLTNFWV